MYSGCGICEAPVAFVCCSRYCQQNPFICNTSCINGASKKIHRNCLDNNIISFNQFEKNLHELVDECSKETAGRHYDKIQKIKKRGQIIKKRVDEIILQYQFDLKKYLKYDLTAQANRLISYFLNFNLKALTGKQVFCLKTENTKFMNCEKIDKEEVKLNQIYSLFLDEIQLILKKSCSYQSMMFSQTKIIKGIDKYQTKKYQQALEYFKQSYLANPFNQQVTYRIASCHYYLKNMQQAQIYVKSYLKNNSREAIGYNLLGNIFHQSKRYFDAILSYSKAIQLDSYQHQYHGNIAFSYRCLNKNKQALQNFQLASKLSQNNEYSKWISQTKQLIKNK